MIRLKEQKKERKTKNRILPILRKRNMFHSHSLIDVAVGGADEIPKIGKGTQENYIYKIRKVKNEIN